MSIIITNITPIAGNEKDNLYSLKINREEICKFKHYRTDTGLARCLRAAADAVDSVRIEERDTKSEHITKEVFEALSSMKQAEYREYRDHLLQKAGIEVPYFLLEDI